MSQTCLDNKERCISSKSALHSPPKLRTSGCGNSIPSPTGSGSQTKFAISFNSPKTITSATVNFGNVCIRTIAPRAIKWCGERYELTAATKVSIGSCCLMEASAGSGDAVVACLEEMANQPGFL